MAFDTLLSDTPQEPDWFMANAPSNPTLGQVDTTAVPGQPNATNTGITGGTTLGYNGQKDLGSLWAYWRSNHPVTAPDMPGFVAFLKQNGVNASQATHAGGQLSDDKLIIDGKTLDFGSSLGSAGGRYFDVPSEVGGDAGGTFGSLLDPYTGATPSPFSFDQFKGPTPEEAANDPGYQFGVQQGEQALTQNRAARGTLNTGGTLKDILDYGRNAATQQWQQVWNRDAAAYGLNRDTAKDVYDRSYNNYVQQYNQFRNRQQDTNQYLTDQQRIGAGV